MTITNPHVLPATTHSYLARAAESLGEADRRDRGDHPLRLRPRRRAAGRGRAARGPRPAGRRPGAGRRRTPGCCSPRSPPSSASGPTFFAAGAAKRAAAEAGSTRAVTEREADDLVRDADRFLAVVEQALGLVPHAPTLPYVVQQVAPVTHLAARRVG